MRNEATRDVHNDGVDRTQNEANEGDGESISYDRRNSPDYNFQPGNIVRNIMPEERGAYAMANSRYIQITLRSPTCEEVSTLMTTITDETDLLIHPEQTKATKRQSREKS